MTGPLESTVQQLVDAAGAGADGGAVLAGVVTSVAAHLGVDVDLRVDGRVVRPDPRVASIEIPESVAHADGHRLPGLVREGLVGRRARRRGGVHHTRGDVAGVIVDLAFSSAANVDIVGDPSVGGGAFLLAAAERLGGPADEVVGRLVGCDIDPLAVATTESAIALWSRGCRPEPGSIRVADFLDPAPFGRERPDVIVGNPPFLGQLRSATGRDDARRARLRARWPGVGGYVDDAGAFLLAAAELVADDGVVALVQPVSCLSARDTARVRERLAEVAPPVAIWFTPERVFDAAVDICAVICRVGAPPAMVRRVIGVEAEEQSPAPLPPSSSWAPLIADLAGTPAVEVDGPPLRSLATVTAGFRDQYYGLRDAVTDDPNGAHPLVTSGLIDPLRSWWGERPCRYDRRKWDAPVVEIDRVDDDVRSWVRDRLRPKLVVASQTRVIEAMADPEGRFVPCTPVVVVEPHDPADLWHLAAVLTSPVAAAEIATEMIGSALSPDALRVSASRLAAVTLPPPGPAWDRAAALAREVSEHGGHVSGVGAAMLEAFALSEESLLEWWVDRLPGGADRESG